MKTKKAFSPNLSLRRPARSRASGQARIAREKSGKDGIPMSAKGWQLLAKMIEQRPGPNDALARAAASFDQLGIE